MTWVEIILMFLIIIDTGIIIGIFLWVRKKIDIDPRENVEALNEIRDVMIDFKIRFSSIADKYFQNKEEDKK